MVINNNNYKIDNINNCNTSPTNQTVIKKISRIPMSKMIVPGNKNYNANAYEKINFKAGGNKYQVLNKNKKQTSRFYSFIYILFFIYLNIK